MKDVLSMNIGGIKCDNPECDYIDMSVNVSEYDKWVNKPCPKCGQNLLTEKDYLYVQFLLKVTNLANEMFPQIDDDAKTVKVNIKMNGSEKMTYDIVNDENSKENDIDTVNIVE